MYKRAGFIANSYKCIASLIRTYIYTYIATHYIAKSHALFLRLRAILSKHAINTARISLLAHETRVKPRAS